MKRIKLFNKLPFASVYLNLRHKKDRLNSLKLIIYCFLRDIRIVINGNATGYLKKLLKTLTPESQA